MWWPWKRRMIAKNAIQKLVRFYDNMRWYERVGSRPVSDYLVHEATKDCLRLMLGRDPTDDEVKEVYSPDLPF